MTPNPVLSEIPFYKLQPAHQYGARAGVMFLVAALTVVLGHVFFPSWSTTQQVFWVLIVAFAAAAIFLGFARKRPRFLLSQDRDLESNQPKPKLTALSGEGFPHSNAHPKLVAWTQSGDVIELVFDSAPWMLVRGDVNDRQWRDVQRLLVWCKRVPSRAVL
jgi:hypothetical protein